MRPSPPAPMASGLKVHPSWAKATSSSAPSSPRQAPAPPKPQSRPRQIPLPPPRKRRRGCCCRCCLWISVAIATLIFLVAIAGGIVYLVYRPHAPKFAVTTLRVSAFNVSRTNLLTSRLDLAVTARNPSKKLVYLYDKSSVSVTSGGVDVGDGSFPAFVLRAGNVTTLHTVLTRSASPVDSGVVAASKKGKLDVVVVVDVKVRAKLDGLKTSNSKVRVTCSGMSLRLPAGLSQSALSPPATCEVKLRVKIWKWYI